MGWDLPSGVFHHDPPREEMGVLELGIEVSGGKSIATSQYHSRALKIIRPHYLDDSGQVYYIIVNPGGGYVGGDAYRTGKKTTAELVKEFKPGVAAFNEKAKKYHLYD